MVGFIFGGNTGRSYEELQKQREAADAIAAQIMGRQLPTTALGGIGALIGGIGAGVTRYGADKGMKEGQQGANSAFDTFLGKIMGGSPSSSSPTGQSASAGNIPMPGAASEVAATSPTGGTGNYRDAIASIESAGSGDYSAIGPKHPKMGRALGRYQIMEANIGPWSQEALGYAITPEQFMADPKLQDAVFDKKFGSYVSKYGPEGAAQAWIGGPGGVGKLDRKDSLGTSVGAYGQKFAKALGGNTEVASLDPSVGMPSAAGAIERQAPASGYVDPMVSAPNAQRPVMAGNAPAPQTQQPVAVPPQPQPQQVAQNGQPPMPPQAPQPQTQNSQFPSPPQPPSPPQAPTNPYQGVDPEMLKLLSNPFLDADKKAILQTVIQQQMQAGQSAQQEQQWRARQDYEHQQQQSDPLYQLKLEAARKEVETGKRQPLVNLGDGTAYDPNDKSFITAPKATGGAGNGQFRFEGKSVEAQALNGLMDTGQLSPDQAQQLGAGKTITGPNGEIIFMTPQGVFGQPSGGGAPQPLSSMPSGGSVDIFGGAPDTTARPPAENPPAPPSAPTPPQSPQAPNQRTGMIPLTEPKVTLDEKKAMTFADRMTQSGALIDQHGNAGASLYDKAASNLPFGLGNYVVTDEYQNLDQARRDFINAQLRRESGAVIANEEFDNANRQYFPQPGDNAETIEQKRRNRQTVIDGMARDGGPTYARPQSAPKADDIAKPSTDAEYNALPSGALFIDPDDGKRYRKP